MLELTSKSLMFVLSALPPLGLTLPFYQYGLWFDIKLVLAPVVPHSIENTYEK